MKKTKGEALKTKAALLDAGLHVLARDGYAEARLEAVSAAAGLTRGAFYWHFKDKADMFNQIEERESGRLNDLVGRALEPAGSPLEKLRRLLGTVIDNFYDNEAFRMYIELTWYKLGAGPFKEIMPAKTAFVQDFLQLLEKLLRQARRAGEVRGDLDVALAAFHLSCLINGFYRLYFVAPARGRDKQKTRRLFADYLLSIGPAKDMRDRPGGTDESVS